LFDLLNEVSKEFEFTKEVVKKEQNDKNKEIKDEIIEEIKK